MSSPAFAGVLEAPSVFSQQCFLPEEKTKAVHPESPRQAVQQSFWLSAGMCVRSKPRTSPLLTSKEEQSSVATCCFWPWIGSLSSTAKPGNSTLPAVDIGAPNSGKLEAAATTALDAAAVTTTGGCCGTLRFCCWGNAGGIALRTPKGDGTGRYWMSASRLRSVARTQTCTAKTKPKKQMHTQQKCRGETPSRKGEVLRAPIEIEKVKSRTAQGLDI